MASQFAQTLVSAQGKLPDAALEQLALIRAAAAKTNLVHVEIAHPLHLERVIRSGARAIH